MLNGNCFLEIRMFSVIEVSGIFLLCKRKYFWWKRKGYVFLKFYLFDFMFMSVLLYVFFMYLKLLKVKSGY